MLQESLDYTFQLPVFEGPLDLLLRLIEREELDITAVALAQVADQYLAHVRSLEAPEPGALSSFLVMAARLLLIKSRALLPRPPAAAGPDDPPDEAAELARQLREYQRYKQAAALLRAWEASGRRSFLRVAAPPTPALPKPDKLDITLSEMIAAVQRRMQLLLPLDPPEVPLPAPKIITVAEMAGRIRERLAAQQWISFEDLLSLAARRVEVIVALWSVLELLKRRAIVVEQEAIFGPIMIGRGQNLSDTDLHELEIDE
ncbi:segregation and condensation protein A [Kouleothrix sp.]|uniref:segregation and condensation protein A n=1 Tax=Kouleothrix sp. TaxID=2779161 RepID=UPI00391D1BCA